MKKVCKKCRVFVKESVCPKCGGNSFTESWKGRVVIFKPQESEIAKKMGINEAGVYAIKTR